MRPIESIVDLGYELRRRYISHKTGRPTAFRKDILQGPKVNGQIRPDLENQGQIWQEAERLAKSGESRFTYTERFNAREVRRRIVFLDETILPSEPGTFGNLELAKLAIGDDLKQLTILEQFQVDLQLAKMIVASNKGLGMAYRILHDYAAPEKHPQLAKSQEVQKIDLSPEAFRDALLQEYDRLLAMSPEQLLVVVEEAKKLEAAKVSKPRVFFYEPSWIDSIVPMMEQRGAEVTVVINTEQGVQIIRESREQGRPFDVIWTQIWVGHDNRAGYKIIEAATANRTKGEKKPKIFATTPFPETYIEDFRTRGIVLVDKSNYGTKQLERYLRRALPPKRK